MDIKYVTFESAKEAVSKNGLEIRYCSPELVCNIEILKEAVKQSIYALREIRNVKMPDTNEYVINNRDLMFEIVKMDAKAYRDIGSNLRDDEEITLYAAYRYGEVVKYASRRLQNNKKVLLCGLSNSIYAIGSQVSEELKNDEEIALAVLKYKHSRINISWFGNKLKQQIIDAVGYDVTLEPLNPIVIEHVRNYLKCKIEGKEFTKPECPFKKEEKQEIKPEIKEEVKSEPKEEINEQIQVKEEVKPESKGQNEPQIEEINEQPKDINTYITEELTKLNLLKELIQKSESKINQLEANLNEVKKENEKLKEDLNGCANNIKKLLLELKK